MMKRCCIGVLIQPVVLSAPTGCNDGTPSVSSSRQEGVVTGAVTVRGKPAGGGVVVFDPANVQRPDAAARRAEIAKDGSYSITTLVGGNVISISGPKFDKDEEVGTSQLTLDVPAGESEFNLVLPRKP